MVRTVFGQYGSMPQEGGRPSRGVRLFVFCLSLYLCQSVQASDLQVIRVIGEAGAPRLALSLLSDAPPDNTLDGDWMPWARERARWLAEQGEWAALAQHLAQLPATDDEEFRRWTYAWRARALLAQGAGAEARAALSTLLWEYGGTDEQITEWRRLIILSYRADGRSDDAYAAWLRYRQDYGVDTREDAVLGARILLLHGRPADAAQLLVRWKDAEAQALRWLGELRMGTLPEQVLSTVQAMLADSQLTGAVRGMWAAVAAEAAVLANDPVARIMALEQRLAAEGQVPVVSDLLSVSATDLWAAYQDYARQGGNLEQLLIGDDAAWLAAAASAKVAQPIRSRAIYALLATEGVSAETRAGALEALAEQVVQLAQGSVILRQLYSHAHLDTMAALPPGVRHVLADASIAAGDYALAARLLEGEAPLADSDIFVWHLRRAQVSIMTGNTADAVAVLHELVEQDHEWQGPQLEQLLQVLFELRGMAGHEAAFPLLEQLSGMITAPQLKRELLYWMADSRVVQQRYREAAVLYLQSAAWPESQAADLWAQQARYQAARALMQAGIPEDARLLYRQLLVAGDDPIRQRLVRRALQQLGENLP